MKVRLVATALAAVALGSLTACGSSSSETATPSAQTAVTTVVTITRAPTTTPLPTTTPDTTDETTSTLQPAPTTTAVTTPAGGRSDYVGHFQRHESTLDLSSDGTGSFLMGANAVDGESWDVSWRPEQSGILVLLTRRTSLTGKGLEAGLHSGVGFRAALISGDAGRVLQTESMSSEIGTLIWCRIGGYSHQCGA